MAASLSLKPKTRNRKKNDTDGFNNLTNGKKILGREKTFGITSVMGTLGVEVRGELDVLKWAKAL